MYKDGLHEHSRLEEEYFYKKERELIEKNKRSEAQKKELLERTQHYHKCSTCGHDMEEVVKDEFSLLFCQHCESVHMRLADLNGRQAPGKLKMMFMDLRDRLQQLKNTA